MIRSKYNATQACVAFYLELIIDLISIRLGIFYYYSDFSFQIIMLCNLSRAWIKKMQYSKERLDDYLFEFYIYMDIKYNNYHHST